MPNTIVNAAYYLWLGINTAAGATVISQAAAIATVKFLAVTAASMAASKLLAPKPPSFADSSMASRSQMVRSPISARTVAYGRSRVSGTIVYMSTTGSTNQYLHMVVALAGHEIEEIEEIYFNDELVPLDPINTNEPTGFYAGVARVNKHLGESTQLADSDLVTDTASLTDGRWTSDHKLSGIAYVYVRLTWDTEKYPSGIPNISAVIKGKKVLDTRTSTTAYSANPALCLRDYLTDSALGMGMSATEIDVTAINAAANICDEQVQILPASPVVYEDRYECNGVIATSASPDENIGKLLSAMGGLIAYSGGKIVAYAGGYRIPTVTLNEKHFVGPLNVQTRTSARDRVNTVKGVYVSETNAWQVSDFPSISSATYVTADNGVKFVRDVVLPFTTSPSCAQRLGVIELRRAREEITFTARFRLEAMQVRAGDTVMITNAKLGWSAKVFEVMEWNFASDGNPPQLFIDMTLRETASSVYSWTVGDQIAVADAANTTLPDPFTLDAPSNLVLTADGTTQFLQSDGTTIPRIKVEWTPPSEQFIQSGGAVVIEYKPTASTTYLTWSRVEGSQDEDYISSDVQIGTSYDVRIFGESYFKVTTDYVTASITVAPDSTLPATPTGLTAVAGTGQAVSLDWDDSTELDHAEYGVYRSDTGIGGTYNKIAEVAASRFVDINVLIGTTYHYKVTDINRSEQESGFSAIVAITPVVVPEGSVDTTPPATPSAPTFVSEATYLSGDGTVFARITIALPALPSGAIGMNSLYRRSGASGFIVGDQVSVGSVNSSIDDLSPGVAYEFAVEAFSFSGAASAISSTLSRTAPNKSTAPADPTGVTTTAPTFGDDFPPVYESSGGTPTLAFGAWLKWDKPTDKDIRFAEYIVKLTGGGSKPLSTDVGESVPADNAQWPIYTVPSFLSFGAWLRFVDFTGNKSDWVTSGPAAWTIGYAGNVGAQNRATINITGGDVTSDTVSSDFIKTGTLGAASVRAVIARFPINSTVSLAGTAAAEKFNIDLTNRGFTTKPDVASGCITSDTSLGWRYDWDDVNNSATQAVIEVYTYDGTNIGAGLRRVSFEFIEYD
jgi:hypothetical protein